MNMNITNWDIAEILGYRITKYQRLLHGQVMDTCYHIRDRQGSMLSKPYLTAEEPISLLLAIEEDLNQSGVRFKTSVIGRLR